MAPAARTWTATVGCHDDCEDVIEAIEVSDMLAEVIMEDSVITEVSDGMVDVTGIILVVDELLIVLK